MCFPAVIVDQLHYHYACCYVEYIIEQRLMDMRGERHHICRVISDDIR